MAASAKGRAKAVCEKRTKEAHFLIKENIEHQIPKMDESEIRSPKARNPKEGRNPKSE
jgi:predicted DNA-binding protein